MLPGNVYHALATVGGLRRGRCSARESKDVKPAPRELIEAVKPYVSEQVWAMIRLQRFTAARAGELAIMRPCDVDRDGKVWVYTPIRNSRIFAAVQNAAVLAGLPDPDQDFADATTKIKSLTVKGTVTQTSGTDSVSTVNLLLAAPTVGPVNLSAPGPANSGSKWGLSTKQREKNVKLRVNYLVAQTPSATTTNPNPTSTEVLCGWRSLRPLRICVTTVSILPPPCGGR